MPLVREALQSLFHAPNMRLAEPNLLSADPTDTLGQRSSERRLIKPLALTPKASPVIVHDQYPCWKPSGGITKDSGVGKV